MRSASRKPFANNAPHYYSSKLHVQFPSTGSHESLSNFEFLRQQWEDSELDVGLDMRPEAQAAQTHVTRKGCKARNLLTIGDA